MYNHKLRATGLLTVAREGITFDSLAKLLEANHELSTYCPKWHRWAELDVERLISKGHGARLLQEVMPRCHQCGEISQVQMRPRARPGSE